VNYFAYHLVPKQLLESDMYLTLAAIFMALTIPAIYVGLQLVLLLQLPFPLFCLPVLLCLGISMLMLNKHEENM
jgi:hypothetical protein